MFKNVIKQNVFPKRAVDIYCIIKKEFYKLIIFFYFRLSTVVTSLATPAPLGDPNGNNDSGYAPSQPDTVLTDSPKKIRHQIKRNGATFDTELK